MKSSSKLKVNSMTEKEQIIFTKLLASGLKLIRSKKPSTAKQYAEQVTKHFSDFLSERDKAKAKE
jgi:hypothetical protein